MNCKTCGATENIFTLYLNGERNDYDVLTTICELCFLTAIAKQHKPLGELNKLIDDTIQYLETRRKNRSVNNAQSQLSEQPEV